VWLSEEEGQKEELALRGHERRSLPALCWCEGRFLLAPCEDRSLRDVLGLPLSTLPRRDDEDAPANHADPQTHAQGRDRCKRTDAET
jgi:hypothetical protein